MRNLESRLKSENLGHKVQNKTQTTRPSTEQTERLDELKSKQEIINGYL